MRYTLRISPTAIKDIRRHKNAGNKKLLQKIEIILEQLQKHPETGVGQPEKLRYDLEGFWSRRINRKHRLIYQIDNNIITVIVVSAYSHYGDK